VCRLSETNKQGRGEIYIPPADFKLTLRERILLLMELTDDELKALDMLLTAERKYYRAVHGYNRINGAFCTTDYDVDDEYINVTITHGVQDDVVNRTTTVKDRIKRSTMAWEGKQFDD